MRASTTRSSHEFRRQAARKPNADSGLRNPSDPKRVIRNKDVTPDELFEVARLVVAAEIAKIHTTEWTPQLLYNEPLYKGMNANWNGLLGTGDPDVSKALSDIIVHDFGESKDAEKAAQWYSVFASGPGIFGLGSKVPPLRHHQNRCTPTAASITSARRSISLKSSSRSIACIRWCPI